MAMAQGNEHDNYGLQDYLEVKFKNLDDKVDGINSRLDKLNGKVSDHATAIKVLEDHDNDIKRVIVGLVALIVGTLVVGFLTGKL